MLYDCLVDIKESLEQFLINNDYNNYVIALDQVEEVTQPTIILYFDNVSFDKLSSAQVSCNFELKFTIADKAESYSEFLQKHQNFIDSLIKYIFENYFTKSLQLSDFSFDSINSIATITYSFITGFNR
ncbi:MAG: hypothetical protein QW044_01965 [Candidatus Anstonellales archaeon]